MTAKIPPYTEVIYDMCDVLDRIATNAVGRQRAYAIATKAASIAIEAAPVAAERLLGSDLVARYKVAAPGMVSVEMTREMADAFNAACANEGNDKIIALLRQVAGPGQQIRTGGRLSDDEKAPVTKSAQSFTPIQEAAIGNFPGLYGLEPKKGPTKR